MNGFFWYMIGLLCGIAIGHEELSKKIKIRIKNLYFKNNFKFVDENGNEIPYQKIIKLLRIIK